MDIFDSNSDFIDATVNLPESQIKEGYADGYSDGLTKGKQDAYEVGLKHGFESGQELGFYRGLVDVWTDVIRVEPELYSSRVKKSIQQLNDEYPFMNPENENKDVVVEKFRLKFKVVCASLGVKLEFTGNLKVDHGY